MPEPVKFPTKAKALGRNGVHRGTPYTIRFDEDNQQFYWQTGPIYISVKPFEGFAATLSEAEAAAKAEIDKVAGK